MSELLKIVDQLNRIDKVAKDSEYEQERHQERLANIEKTTEYLVRSLNDRYIVSSVTPFKNEEHKFIDFNFIVRGHEITIKSDEVIAELEKNGDTTYRDILIDLIALKLGQIADSYK